MCSNTARVPLIKDQIEDVQNRRQPFRTLLRRRQAEWDAGRFDALLAAADPLNMLGILVPGPRLAPAASNRLLYRDGVPTAVLEAREVRFLVEMNAADQWQARSALLRRRVPPKVRAYLNQSGSTTSPTTISRLTH